MARLRNTQKDLLFGIYNAPSDSPNPGIAIWFRGRYIWPRKRKPAKSLSSAQMNLIPNEEPVVPVWAKGKQDERDEPKERASSVETEEICHSVQAISEAYALDAERTS